MRRPWRFVDTGAASGGRNMAVDEVLCGSVAAGDQSPVLRLYRWQPPAVSVGYAQRAQREVDLDRCRSLGIAVVRRPTGGRAVLHWEELTYSVVCPAGDAQLGGTVGETYRLVGACLVAALTGLGVPAVLERRGGRGIRPRGPGATVPCFSSMARWEVMCHGRKLVGSAQCRRDGVILQHGSLLTGPAHQRIVELVQGLSDAQRGAWRRQLADHSTDLAACGRPGIGFSQLRDALLRGFADTLGAEIRAQGLTVEERRLAEGLTERKYADLAREDFLQRPRRSARTEFASACARERV